jgi:PilZ domain
MPLARISSDITNAPADRDGRQKRQKPAGRLARRTASPSDLWVYWHSESYGNLSRVREISVQGLVIETPQAIPVGETINLSFLLEKGQLRAQAVVRYVKPGFGLGLTFRIRTEVEDRTGLTALLTNIRVSGQLQDQPKEAENLSILTGKQVAQ